MPQDIKVSRIKNMIVISFFRSIKAIVYKPKRGFSSNGFGRLINGEEESIHFPYIYIGDEHPHCDEYLMKESNPFF